MNEQNLETKHCPFCEFGYGYHDLNCPATIPQVSLADALRAGYAIYDRNENGYLVRTRTAAGWAFAIVDVRTGKV